MFKRIFRFELISWIKSYSFYLLIGAFFILPLILFLGTGGYFESGARPDFNSPQNINSPYHISSFLQTLGKFLLFAVPAVMGTTFYKDYQYNVYSLLYSFPVTKGVYLSAKFTSSFLIVLIISIMPGLSFITGEIILGINSSDSLTGNFSGYLFTYGVILLPNLLIFGIIICAVVVFFRNLYAGFIVALLLIIIQLIAENLFHSSALSVGLADPFGQYASLYQAHNWTLAERNTQSLQITSMLAGNRLLWSTCGILAGILIYRNFSLHQFPAEIQVFKRKVITKKFLTHTVKPEAVTDLKLENGFRQGFLQLSFLIRLQLKYLLKNWVFLSFTLMSIILFVVMLHRVLHSAEAVMLPLTRLILQIPVFFNTILAVLATFIFAGMIVLRGKDSHMESLIHSTPTRTSIMILSNAISLIIVQLILLSVIMITGITMQITSGYFHPDLKQYFISLYVLQAPILAVWAMVSVLIFSITRKFYFGLFFLVMLWLAQFGYENLGINSRLFQFNTFPIINYSDFNGFGAILGGRLVLQAYWLSWGSLFLLTAVWIWPRIQTERIRKKLDAIKTTLSKESIGVLTVILILISFLSVIIFQAEKAAFQVNESQKTIEDFKTEFSALSRLPQPRITSVSLRADLFPEKNSFSLSGSYTLVNRTNIPIDTLLVKTSIDEITSYQLTAGSRKVDSFPDLNFDVHRLETPLQPGDSVSLTFSLRNQPNTLFQLNSPVLSNGTFITQDVLPRIGYFLHSDEMDPEESSPIENHYQSWDSDLVNYKAILSTSSDQFAITNGILTERWQADNRIFYSYRSAKPIKFNFHINSGKYAVQQNFWRMLPVNIYYHNTHTHNLESMIRGVEASLEFNSRLFGHMPDQEISIIEYPATAGSFSTLKSNHIIISESVFGVNTAQKDKINLPFYIAAHEMTHHWFGNLLIPKDASGAVLLTESITEYISLQIYEEAFGAGDAGKFLELQHKRYFSGRANEADHENPLYLVEPGQEYLAYGKGSIALHAIAHEMGTKRFHQLLSEFISRYDTAAAYPRSIDFIEFLKSAAETQSQALIEEMLMQTVIYDSEVISAKTKERTDQGWDVEVNYIVQAFDGNRKISSSPRRTVDLGIYDENLELIQVIPISTSRGQETLHVLTEKTPYQLILDPHFYTLDRDRTNNEYLLKNEDTMHIN